MTSLTPNLSGLAEPEDGLEPGQLVSVYIRSILPEKQKIKLTVLEQLDPKAYTGRSGSQVTEFLRDVVRPLLEQYGNENLTVELRV